MEHSMHNIVTPTGLIRKRQAVLRESYLMHPEMAWVTDYACTDSSRIPATDALHNSVAIDRQHKINIFGGVHTAVGGDSDAPTPGDILCGAIAACFDSTMRVTTNNLGISLTELRVEVSGRVDVRGSLMIDPATPVGFQAFDVKVSMQSNTALPENQKRMLLKATERSCIVMQSLRGNPTITFSVSLSE